MLDMVGVWAFTQTTIDEREVRRERAVAEKIHPALTIGTKKPSPLYGKPLLAGLQGPHVRGEELEKQRSG